MTTLAALPADAQSAVEARLARVLAVHFDPECGTPFWLDRAAKLGIDPRRDIHHIDDLQLLGETTQQELRSRPIRDLIPRRFHRQLDQFLIAQTGGATGDGVWTAWRRDEFEAAFITPFVEAAPFVGFPEREPWLYVGPTGPHIIGRAARVLARRMGGPEPFMVDFDPRWARKLAPGSFASQRYLEHVVDQAMAVIRSQDVGVLFATPPALLRLADRMSPEERERIRGVHYGGMALQADSLRDLQLEHFPNAAHLSGYGNTLFGCCLELSAAPDRSLDYFPHGDRLTFDVDASGPDAGVVRFTRLDESFLIIRMPERDRSVLVPPPKLAPSGFVLPGLRNPTPRNTTGQIAVRGLY